MDSVYWVNLRGLSKSLDVPFRRLVDDLPQAVRVLFPARMGIGQRQDNESLIRCEET